MMRRLVELAYPSPARARCWLEQHPRLARALQRTGCLRPHRRAVARGVAIGLFVALTPTVGVQTIMMLSACLLVRGNFPAAFLISWISNPITMAPLYLGYHALGERVFAPAIEAGLELTGYGPQAALEAGYLALGSLLVATPTALAGYWALTWGGRAWTAHRRSRGPHRARCATPQPRTPPAARPTAAPAAAPRRRRGG